MPPTGCRTLAVALGLTVAALLPPRLAAQAQMDEYARYELSAAPAYRLVYDVSVTRTGATTYADAIPAGATVRAVTATDLMTGAALKSAITARAVVVTLARPVPANGHGRIRIEKTVADGRALSATKGVTTFTQIVPSRRGSIVLPAGFELLACDLPAQVHTEADGRIAVSFMHQAPGATRVMLRMRPGLPTGPDAAPTPLTNRRSWEPPPAEGPAERTRLAERARQDRDITYFLEEPSTHAFSLFHDYTESRPGIDRYVNVVRSGATVSKPSAYVLDTGEPLPHVTLRGAEITAAKIDAGGAVAPDTEAVVISFPPVQAGQSLRLRISETYTAPESYRLEGRDLVFDRRLGRPRNSVVLPGGWFLTASSIPAVISETADGRIRLDFFNGRNDAIDVLIKGRRRPAK
jgi:hypothetical protein